MFMKARNGISRSIKTSQIGLFEMNMTVDTAALTLGVSGFDRLRVANIVRNSAGNVTIIFKQSFTRPPILKSVVANQATPVLFRQVASDIDRITIELLDEDAVAADAVANICILGSDDRIDR